jgi:hypothetical protein
MQVDVKAPKNAQEAKTYVWRVVNALAKAHVDALKQVIVAAGDSSEQARAMREVEEVQRAMFGMVAIELYLTNREAQELRESVPL